MASLDALAGGPPGRAVGILIFGAEGLTARRIGGRAGLSSRDG
jgi:hypothetical protein